jgi:hypothetical protein
VGLAMRKLLAVIFLLLFSSVSFAATTIEQAWSACQLNIIQWGTLGGDKYCAVGLSNRRLPSVNMYYFYPDGTPHGYTAHLYIYGWLHGSTNL